MPKQSWLCEGCGTSGKVDYPEGAGVMQVVYLIEDDHKAAAPGCAVEVEALRVPTTTT